MSDVARKASRIIREGRIHATDGTVFEVVGDEGDRYITAVYLNGGEPQTSCTCMAGRTDKTCKHVLAAIGVMAGRQR